MRTQLNSVISPRWRPEAELLLLCARTRLKPDKAQRLRELLKKGIDWNYLVRQALFHGAMPLLFRNLSLVCPDGIPKATLNQLRDYSNAIARSNLCLTGELLHLLNLFRKRGIRALPLKGPSLAVVVYENLALRHFSDLDILVARDDMLKAKELLILQGYRPKLKLTASQELDYLESHHDYKFLRADDGLVVEIQWGITESLFGFPLNFADLWQRRKTLPLADAGLFSLALEDLLLLLCVHGAKHRWEQLKWICDIAELVDAYRQKIDWSKVLERARMLGGERMLLLGLFLAHDLLGADVPTETLKKIAGDPEIKWLTGKVSDGLFRKESNPVRLSDEAPFFYWKVRERLRDKLEVLWKYFPAYFLRAVVPNRKDYAFLRLPSCLCSSYYLIRPVRLLWECWFNFRHRLYR
jgi:Uncharacterised nucleotidyltransferase